MRFLFPLPFIPSHRITYTSSTNRVNLPERAGHRQAPPRDFIARSPKSILSPSLPHPSSYSSTREPSDFAALPSLYPFANHPDKPPLDYNTPPTYPTYSLPSTNSHPCVLLPRANWTGDRVLNFDPQQHLLSPSQTDRQTDTDTNHLPLTHLSNFDRLSSPLHFYLICDGPPCPRLQKPIVVESGTRRHSINTTAATNLKSHARYYYITSTTTPLDDPPLLGIHFTINLNFAKPSMHQTDA
ncbi:hypothetical protein VTL71DRAFT_11720 [Oculimacula yallundae]|uniref:Uncharacterized protein n=1 Tax=Oculimacula yallundae TaxID=86028 RepID=A0ABR4CS21_9HELO